MSGYPEHEKLAKIGDKSQAIGEFLDWLQSSEGIVLMRYSEDHPVPIGATTEDLLGKFFDIDRHELEREKRAMLAALREANA